MNYFTGVDVHNNFCQFQHMDATGALGLTMRVATNREGFDEFLNGLDGPTEITLEAGRNYWWMHEFFSSHPKVAKVNVVDPRRSRNIAKELAVHSGYGRAKNDRIDGEMLADQTRRGLAPTIHVPTPEQLEQRSLTRNRLMLVINHTRKANLVHSILAIHGTSVNMNNLVTKPTYREEILKTVPAYVSFIVNQLVEQCILLDRQIDLCETELERVVPASQAQISLLLTVPGIGIVLARIIHTEIMDIVYFKEPKYLISYSGLAPMENESAGKKGIINLNRHCNYYLKYAFIEAAHHASSHIKYRRKYELDVKKHGKMIAKLNLARRLAKSIYWILTRQQPYHV